MSVLKAIWDNGWAVLRARWYLRKANRLGGRVRVWGKPVIHNGGSLEIGERVRLVSTIATMELVSGPNGRLAIGDGSFINYGTSISADSLVSIGADCRIGTYVIILDNNFHSLEPELRDVKPESAPVIIGEKVWLGARVVVLPGVSIGDGSVIGAGSVVTRDIPARSLAAGVPARVIRDL